MDEKSNGGSKRKSSQNKQQVTDLGGKRSKMAQLLTDYESYGDEGQRYLICKWVLDNVGRFGWGSAPVTSENKKAAWLELWEYANHVVGLTFPSVDRIMKFIKTIRQSIFEKMKDGKRELNDYEKVLFEAMTNPERIPAAAEPDKPTVHDGVMEFREEIKTEQEDATAETGHYEVVDLGVQNPSDLYFQDVDQLRQIEENMSSNHASATSFGQEVSISTEREEEAVRSNTPEEILHPVGREDAPVKIASVGQVYSRLESRQRSTKAPIPTVTADKKVGKLTTKKSYEELKLQILEEELEYLRSRTRWMKKVEKNADLDEQFKLKRLELLCKRGNSSVQMDNGEEEDPFWEDRFGNKKF